MDFTDYWDLMIGFDDWIPSGFIKHGWLENGPFIIDFPMKTSVSRECSIAMFDYQRVRPGKLTNAWKIPSV